MPSSPTSGSSPSISSRQRRRHRPSPSVDRLSTPETPANPFRAGVAFRGFSGSHIATACQVACPPCTDLTGSLQPSGTFTSGLQTGWSPFPPPDITTAATGLLCWRDLHPLERQLASLHQHSLPSGRYALLRPVFHRLDRTSLRLAHSFNHLIGEASSEGGMVRPSAFDRLRMQTSSRQV